MVPPARRPPTGARRTDRQVTCRPYARVVTDSERLLGYVDIWWEAVGDLLDTLSALSPAQWDAPTDLPGWDVRAVASHVAHLESVLAGDPEESVDIGPAEHVRSALGIYTEHGVVARRGKSGEELIAEIRDAATRRYQRLQADPPRDGAARPDIIFGALPWDWDLLLRNRIVDVWMHDGDIRAAVGMPANADSRAATHTIDQLTGALPMVIAKRAEPPAGSVVVIAIGDRPAMSYVVDPDGRARLAYPAADQAPTVRIGLSEAAFVSLAGGRSRPDAHELTVEGDEALAQRLLGAMAVTP